MQIFNIAIGSLGVVVLAGGTYALKVMIDILKRESREEKVRERLIMESYDEKENSSDISEEEKSLTNIHSKDNHQ